MNRSHIASELLKVVKELTAKDKVFEYYDLHSTVEFAQALGWREDPEVDDKYLDDEGYLDEDKALDEAFKFIRRKGWKIKW
jgi:hypothetical protein